MVTYRILTWAYGQYQFRNICRYVNDRPQERSMYKCREMVKRLLVVEFRVSRKEIRLSYEPSSDRFSIEEAKWVLSGKDLNVFKLAIELAGSEDNSIKLMGREWIKSKGAYLDEKTVEKRINKRISTNKPVLSEKLTD